MSETKYENEKKMFFGLVKRIVIPAPDLTPYIVRWIFKLPFGRAIYLHKILQGDEDRELHDHPWNFLSILLWGSYIEVTPGELRVKRWFNYHKATDRHRLFLQWKKGNEMPVWTLIFRGKRTRDWGFHTKDGWVHWREYNAKKFGKEVV